MGLGNRYSQHSFAMTPAVHSPRSVFDRSFTKKDTFYFDQLMPIFVDEILPGDTCNLNVSTFGRLSTQVVPLMDNAYVDFFFFFVPNRLVWTNWEKFNGAQTNPGDSISYTVPQMTAPAVTGFIANSIADHFGLPTEIASINVNALPFRGLALIWNQWFRDQNLQDSITVNTGDGPDLYTAYAYDATFCKKHDYFTSCLPWPQKGTALNIPVTGAASTVTLVPHTTSTAAMLSRNAGTGALSPATTGVSTKITTGNLINDGDSYNMVIDPNARLTVTPLMTGTINDLRLAFQVQTLLEIDARGGTRYVEILLAHWNVVSPDFRLQRPEFLGSSTITINSHPVPQTSATSGSNYQGKLASFGTLASQGGHIGFSKSFVEHGFVIGLMRARGEITYQQGINRMWSRSTRYDYFWPALQDIGEQAVLKQELSASGGTAVFGYQERYAEYRYKPSEICGEFRSNFATPLDSWHLAQDLAGSTLNDDFITSDTPIERNLASVSNANLLMDFFFNYKHARVMKTYSVPASLGRL
ncbi:MAG: major capsid protein [Microvirus sp.]|nr:MAG: major capsid protein [Microvirus sp.]